MANQGPSSTTGYIGDRRGPTGGLRGSGNNVTPRSGPIIGVPEYNARKKREFESWIRAMSAPKLDDAAARWISAASGGAPSTGGGSYGGGGGGGGVPNMGGVFGSMEATTNQQFDMQRDLLRKLVAEGQAGIDKSGNDVRSQLEGLMTDTAKQGKSVASALKKLYASQMTSQQGDVQAGVRDLERWGVGAGVVQAEARRNASELRQQGGRSKELQARMAEVLGQNMQDRIAGAAELTAGTKQQLDSKQAMLLAQLEQQRLAALQEIAQQRAAAAAAASRGGGGGGRGGSGSTMSVTQGLALAEALGLSGQGAIDYAKLAADSGVNMKDAGVSQYMNEFLKQLGNGTGANTLAQGWSSTLADPANTFAHGLGAENQATISNFLNAAQRAQAGGGGRNASPEQLLQFLRMNGAI
jgi:hypothetical protein